ncbi:hypothetical protein [Actibacterium sp. 188UL27-1]|uniref:hypothetical protein n=1 Tax=Actibacterium sp. 188UL27-1 TaxID=2786961 RepID=UPI0019586114|nr:hypothetical protein [Actibacterium sp. 188UL27-1]MBM7068288.1 hypothetical protein [Actibacterium sp. 188UL27-1]
MPIVAVIRTPGFADWEYVLIGGTGGLFYELTISYVTPNPTSVTSQGGLSAAVPQGLDTIAPLAPDAIAVIGARSGRQRRLRTSHRCCAATMRAARRLPGSAMKGLSVAGPGPE